MNMVSANINKQFIRVTAIIAATTVLIGPALAEPQTLTNTSLPVGTLSEKQTRRLLSAANLKAKMQSAMRLGKKPATAAKPQVAMTGGAAPATVAETLRPPISVTSPATGETTSPGWQDDPDALQQQSANGNARSLTPTATPPATTTAAPAETTAAAAPAAPTATAPEAGAPASTTAEATAAPEAGAASTTAATATETTTTSDTTAAAATATTKVGEFNVPTLSGTELIKSADSVAMNPAMGDAMITSSPALQGEVSQGVIVIDNDEEKEQTVTIAYEEMQTTEGNTAVKAGARFPVVMMSEINSKTAKKGDPIEARLKYDLKIGPRHIANKGSRVRGHLDYVLKARTVIGSMVTTQRFYRNSGVLGIAFDELINESGEHFALQAKPAMMDRIVKNKYEGRELGVNHNGQVAGPFSQQLRYKAIRVGMNFAMAPLGPLTFGAMPVALGVMGAANPSFAFMKPVGLNVRHRRIKGFAWGFLSGIPGSWLIEDTTVRGQEAIIKPGDEFLAVFKEEFKGEAVTDASMLPGGGTKVKGEVLSGVKAPTKKKTK